MGMYEIIHRKRLGQELSPEDIRLAISGYTAGDIPDYQMAALAMAICLNGMTVEETRCLTREMMLSGDQLDLSAFGDKTVDKHSTGGVGDKTSLIVAPIVSALGGKVAKMSGRGLGHTGGTVDKLESIPGYRTQLEPAAFLRQVEQVGMAVIGQTGNLAPADKKLYALRDVTATVDSIPLIASSIMSKKLAAGAHSIVLDVKVGAGAFMKTKEDGEQLGQRMVDIAAGCGRRASALLTDMDVPLGWAVGNALEVQEAAEVLQGRGQPRLWALCRSLAVEMLCLCRGWSPEEAGRQVDACVESGAAFRQMCRWVEAQGGDAAYLRDPSRFPAAPAYPVPAPADGFITAMDAEAIGSAAVLLGAGRAVKDDAIDHAAGFKVLHTVGERVEAGQPVAMLYTNRPQAVEEAVSRYQQALTLGGRAPAAGPVVLGVIRG